MVELRLSLLTAGSGQRVSTYRTLVNDKQCAQFFIRAHFCKIRAKYGHFFGKNTGKIQVFCDLVVF